MKVALFSTITEDYVDKSIIAIYTFKKHFNRDFTWYIHTNGNKDKILERLKPFHNDIHVNDLYKVTKDFKKYNKRAMSCYDGVICKWSKDEEQKMFLNKLLIIDSLKSDYDILIPFDVDILVQKDLISVIDNFFSSEYAMLVCGKESGNNWINDGFCLMNTRFLVDNHYEKLLEMSKGVEFKYPCPDQQLLTRLYFNNSKIDPLINTSIWSKQPNFDDAFVIHFTKSWYNINNQMQRYKYEEYKGYIELLKEHLTKDFIKNIEEIGDKYVSKD